MKEEKEKRNKVLMRAAMAIMALVLVIILLYLITQKRETRTSEANNESEISALTCRTNSNEFAFFVAKTANEVEHELRLVYSDGKLDKMSYVFRGEHVSNESARQEVTNLHAQYDTYIGQYDMDPNSLTPNFKPSENKSSIMLYLDNYKKMNSVYGKFFFINSGDIDKLGKYSKEETKNYYENKGFSCIISD